MKWIGQHIYDNISRFRDDVYIENLSTTTETDVLVVDSTGKVSKNTIEDLHHDTSSQASVDNSGSTYIQDVTLDTYGHVTALTSAAIPTLNQDTTGLAGTVTALATARTIGGTSFDGTGNIAVAAATNLTASTSTAVGLGTIELGHATDTTIARSAAGVVTIEGNKIETRKTLLHLQQTSFSRDIATTEFFIPFNAVAESTSITNINIPMVMPVDGKLLKLHMRANQNQNTSSNTVTFKLYDIDDGENWSAGASNVLGTKVIDGEARTAIMVADFTDLTTSGASGTNAFSAGDSIGVTIQNSQDLALTNYLVTMVFELDFNSY